MDPITIIITGIVLGALGNGLYDIVIKGIKRPKRQPKLEKLLRNQQWKRLYGETGLGDLVETYRKVGSQDALIEIGKALNTAFQSDEFKDLASDVQEILASQEVLKDIMEVGFSQLRTDHDEIKTMIRQMPSGSVTIQINQYEIAQINGNALEPMLMKGMLDDYLRMVAKQHEYLNMIDLRLRRQIRLEDIYVTLKMAKKVQKPEMPEMEDDRGNEIALQIWRDRGQRQILEQLEDVELEDVLDEKCLVFRGDPGAGKTTLLKHLAYTYSAGDDEEYPIPVFIMLTDLMDRFNGNLDEWLQYYYRRQADLLREKLEDGECIVLLDGLDEVAKDKWGIVGNEADRLAKWDNQVIVSCRGAAYYGGSMPAQFKVYEVVGFSEEQQQKFLNKWFGVEDGRAERLFENLKSNSRMLELTQNPLLLSLTAVVCENDPDFQLPVQRIELYEKAVEFLMRRWRSPGCGETFDAGHKRGLLGEMALRYLSKGAEIFKREDVLDEIEVWKNEKGVFTEGTREALLEELSVHNGFLVSHADDYYRFLHLTFQEYFAAYDIYRRCRDDVDGIWAEISLHLHNSRWREVILLLVAKLDREYDGMGQKLVEKILNAGTLHEDLLKRDLFMAGSCLADDVTVLVGTYEEILAEIIGVAMYSPYRLQQGYSVDILRELSNSQYGYDIMDGFLELLSDEDPDIRRKAVNPLGNIGEVDKRVIDKLVQLLDDEDSDVRWRAADALGGIGKVDERGIQKLIERLDDDDFSVSGSAMSALGNVGKEDDRVIQKLMKKLDDENPYVRIDAVDALGKTSKADERYIQKLMEMLDDRESRVRSSAANALGSIGKADKGVTQELVGKLDDESPFVRGSAVDALGKTGRSDNWILQKLVERLDDSHILVRRSAAQVLGDIGESYNQVIQKLMERLNDKSEESYVRSNSAKALGSIGKADDQIIQMLVEKLEDTDFLVREAAASALGNIGKADDRIIQKLLERLDDRSEESYVRESAAFALGSIGRANERVTQKLTERLKSEEPGARMSVVNALRAVGKLDSRIIGKLIERLDDENSLVRISAASALGRIGITHERVFDILKDTCENYINYFYLVSIPEERHLLPIYNLAFRTLWRYAK